MEIRRGLGNRLHGDRPAHSGVLQGCARIPMSDVPENQKQARQESLAIARAQRGQSIDTAGRAKGRDAFRRGPSRPGRNRTCNPRFWSPLPATPALERLLIFKDLAPSEQRRRRWTTPALALILALSRTGPA